MNTHKEIDAEFTIVFLAYDSDSFKYQAILSILTLYHHIGPECKNFSIVIYTDNKTYLFEKYLADLPVTLEVLSAKEANLLQGTDKYIFRMKPLILKKFFSKYKRNVFYIDTDTYFVSNPVELLNDINYGKAVMDKKEYNLLDGIDTVHGLQLRQCLKSHEFTVQNKSVNIPISTTMWNAGVIGISYENANLVDIIIDLTDDIYSKCKIFLVEQFVTSFILQSNTKLISSENYIEHYWIKSIKNAFNVNIPIFLKLTSDKRGEDLYRLSFEFACKTKNEPILYRDSFFNRIKKRLNITIMVIIKGHI